jgi:hypothetical protein
MTLSDFYLRESSMVQPRPVLPDTCVNRRDPYAVVQGSVFVNHARPDRSPEFHQVRAIRDVSGHYALTQAIYSPYRHWSESGAVVRPDQVAKAVSDRQAEMAKQYCLREHIPSVEFTNGVEAVTAADMRRKFTTLATVPPADPDMIIGSCLSDGRDGPSSTFYQITARKIGRFGHYLIEEQHFTLIWGFRIPSDITRKSIVPLDPAVHIMSKLQREKMEVLHPSDRGWREVESANLSPNGVFRVAARHGIFLPHSPL